jgi:hypothetical protein
VIRGDRGLAGERVQAHQAALEIEAVEQVRQDGQLAPLLFRRPLGGHQPALGGVGAHQVQGRAALLAVEGPPHRLAVDRDLPQPVPLGPEYRPHPTEERALERLRVDEHQHTAEGVVRRLGLAEDGANRDHQDVDQLVLDLPGATWILDGCEFGDQGFEHGLPPLGRPSLSRSARRD